MPTLTLTAGELVRISRPLRLQPNERQQLAGACSLRREPSMDHQRVADRGTTVIRGLSEA